MVKLKKEIKKTKTVKKPIKKKTTKTKSKTHEKRVKPSVRKSLDSLKQELYGIKNTIESDTPEQKKIHLQTITFELAAIKQLMDRVLAQLKTVEEHLEEIKNR